MREFRKIFILVATSLGSLIGTSCANKVEPMYSNLHVLENTAEGFLHYVDYDDYREDTEYECINSEVIDVGCASVRCGDIYGRNLDYYYSNTVNFVVHVKGNDHRYESIGTARHAGFDNVAIESIEKSGKYSKHIEYIPNLTADGINENGVVCNFNIVDLESFRHPTGTHPGKKKLHMYYACRYILDNAKSAAHAIELLDDRDIFLPKYITTNIHLMIADPKETYIVEFVNHQMIAKKKTGDDQIMTNFYNNLGKEGDESGLNSLKEHAMGVERYRWLRGRQEDLDYFYTENNGIFEDYPEECKGYFTDRAKPTWEECPLNSVDGMMTALENVKMSRGYLTEKNTPDPDQDDIAYPIWPSEDIVQSTITSEPLFEKWQEEFKYYYFDYVAALGNRSREIGLEWEIWTTRHSVVYDIKNKTMRIVGEEDYDNPTNFKLNGEVIK